VKRTRAPRRAGASRSAPRAVTVGLACACALAVTAPGAGAASRGYEQVNPADEGGYTVRWEGATPDGEHAFWSTEGSPAGAEPDGGSFGFNLDAMISGRTATGWVTKWVTPGGSIAQGGALAPFIAGSTDGQRVLWFSSEALSGDDADTSVDVYLSGPDGSQLITPSSNPANPTQVAGSDDLGVIAWGTVDPVGSGDSDALRDIYARGPDGQVHQVSVSSTGSDPGVANALMGFNNRSVTSETGNFVSRDGSRIFFTTADSLVPADTDAAADLYVRVNFNETRRVSPSGASTEVTGISPDGTYAFVATNGAWVGADTNGRIDQYRITVDTGEVVRLTDEPTALATLQQGLYAWSDDGKHAVLPTRSVLDPVADTDSNMSVYRWDEGQTPTYLGPATAGDRLASFTAGWTGGRSVRMSRDGSTVAFSTIRQRTLDDTDSTEDVYVHRTGGALTRISQSATGGNAPIAAQLAGNSFVTPSLTVGRGMSGLDASHVYFTTAEPLLPADTNTKADVYDWSAGGLELISPGNADFDAVYADNSLDGDDVFFRTTQPINGGRGGAPLYFDARAGGGFTTPAAGGAEGSVGAPVGGGGGPAGGVPAASPPASASGGQGNSVPPEPADAPTEPVRFEVQRVTVGKSGLKLELDVPGAGDLRLRLDRTGGRSRPPLATARRSFDAAGTATISLRLTPAGRRELARKGRLRVALKTTFTPRGGRPITTRRSVVLTRAGRTGAGRGAAVAGGGRDQ
jgi:hypothetical protein